MAHTEVHMNYGLVFGMKRKANTNQNAYSMETMENTNRFLTPEWIAAGLAVGTSFIALVGAYIKYKIDKASIFNELNRLDIKMGNDFENVCLDLEEHKKNNNDRFKELSERLEVNRKENREDFQNLNKSVNEIKSYLMNGRSK